MSRVVTSVNQVPIRLTDERWEHITEEHGELAAMEIEVLETLANGKKCAPTISLDGLRSRS